MVDWIATNTLDLAVRRGKNTAPRKFHLMLSPYDVPNALRAYMDAGFLVIEFRYIKIRESRSVYIEFGDEIELEVGDKTKRIYKIFSVCGKCSENELRVYEETEQIESAIGEFISKQEKIGLNTAKYKATQSVIRDHQESIAIGFKSKVISANENTGI